MATSKKHYNVPVNLTISYGEGFIETGKAKKIMAEYMLRHRASYPSPPHCALFIGNRELAFDEIKYISRELDVKTRGDLSFHTSWK